MDISTYFFNQKYITIFNSLSHFFDFCFSKKISDIQCILEKKIIFSPVSYVFVFTTPYLIKNTLLYQPHFLSFLAFLSKKMLIYQFFLEQHISYYTTKISVLFLFIKKKYTSILTSFLIFWTFFQKLPLFQCILENKNKPLFTTILSMYFDFFDQNTLLCPLHISVYGLLK